jgi:hypothetical protein
MITLTPSIAPAESTLADLLEQLGNIPPDRILVKPPLGTATEKDVLEVERRKGLAPELIDGVLEGGDVLPGFQLIVKELFATP